MKYKIGDRVKAIKNYDCIIKDKKGTIVDVGEMDYGVNFDDAVGGWNLGKPEIEDLHGLFVPEECLELIPSKTGEDMLKELGYERNKMNEDAYYRQGGWCENFENWFNKETEFEIDFYNDKKIAKSNEFGDFEPITIPELKAIIQIFREKGVEI